MLLLKADEVLDKKKNTFYLKPFFEKQFSHKKNC